MSWMSPSVLYVESWTWMERHHSSSRDVAWVICFVPMIAARTGNDHRRTIAFRIPCKKARHWAGAALSSYLRRNIHVRAASFYDAIRQCTDCEGAGPCVAGASDHGRETRVRVRG